MELTLLTQAIKVLSYTHIQAIMGGVGEIQMSEKKKEKNKNYLSVDADVFTRL